MSDERPKKTPSLLHRDANNKLIDPNEGRKVAEELTKKFLTEQRAVDKDNTLHMARTGRRDVVVHLAVTVLGQQDGHPILGERDQEYNQWCFRINARQLPVSNGTIIKALSELAHLGKSAFIKLGMVRG